MRAVLSIIASLLVVSEAASVISHGSNHTDACGRIFQQGLRYSPHELEFRVPGELAYQCLKSMPFEPQRAVAFVDEYRRWLEFQSTIEILKSPPDGYPMPPTDLLGGLDDIQAKAAASVYDSHYDFDVDVRELLTTAYDGHLSLGLCSTDIFQFRNDAPLVSISPNGTTIPKVYLKDDAALKHTDPEASVSSVISINGVDVDVYMSNITRVRGAQDWDALYNQAFVNDPSSVANSGQAGGEPGLFSFSPSDWPGAYQAVRFANGTTRTFETYVLLSGFEYRSGRDLYASVCLPSHPRSVAMPSSKATPAGPSSSVSLSIAPTTVTPVPSNYPKPFVRDQNNKIMGFFPDAADLNDSAVLVVTTFMTDQPVEFAKVGREFLNNATKFGKSKLVIDLSGNGGGLIPAGWNLFRMIFPEQQIFSASRFRANEASKLLGELLEVFPPSEAVYDPYVRKSKVTPDQKEDFDTWKAYYGPYSALGVNSSALAAPNMTLAGNSIYPLNGYGNQKANPSKAPFNPNDIIIITDGICASTCALFAELMKMQGVRSIAFGGRPRNGPMQAIGGVKGSKALEFPAFADELKDLYGNATKNGNIYLTKAQQDLWDEVIPGQLNEFSYKVQSGSVNHLNAFSPQNDELPLQFVFEAAECRRFFTYENVANQITTWSSAVEAMFNDGGCVPGSTNATGSLFA